MRTPSLKAIKTFQIAAKHSSFAVAADELCITPSAVSHQIKTLETQLGLPLFSRSARALALTDAGARYLEQIDDLFMRLEAVTEQLRARFGRSSVRLHVPAYFASEMLLPQALGVLEAARRASTCASRRRACTAARTRPKRTSPWWSARGRGTGPDRAPAVRADHGAGVFARVARGKTGDSLRRSQFAHAAGARGAPRRLGSLGRERRHEDSCNPAQIVRIDSMSAATRAAEKSIGIALLPAELSRRKFASGRLMRVFDDELVTQENYTLLVRTEDENRDDIRALCAWLIESCRSGEEN